MKNLKLKSARAALDLSQQQLADLVGVSRQTINAIEKGDYNPTINLCRSICKVLHKTLDDLFWEETEADFSGEYKVQAGDTLWSVAKLFHTDIQHIAYFNNLEMDSYLSIGKILKVPAQPEESL